MDLFATSHFSDDVLLLDAKQLAGQRSKTTAMLLTRIAEIDQRQLFRRAGYSSLYAYCLGELHLLEDSACRHIHVARLARQYPVILFALAEHRLCMRAVLMLARHLNSGNADELVAAASHKTRFEIQQLLAERFPQPDLPEWLQAIPPPPSLGATTLQPDPGGAELSAPERIQVTIPEQAIPVPIDRPAGASAPQQIPVRVESPVPVQRVTPLAPERFGLQATLDQETFELLQRARELMSHQNPKREIVPILNRALRLLVADLEKQKFATTSRPRAPKPTTSPRHIPAEVRRAVAERDGGRCTFVSDAGRRCDERGMIEFDHENPVASGGTATVENVRLLCHAHNQYAAERAFGSEFMERKRAEARRNR